MGHKKRINNFKVKIRKDFYTESGVVVCLYLDGYEPIIENELTALCGNWFLKFSFKDLSIFLSTRSSTIELTEKNYQEIKKKILTFKNFQ